ncbi:hypothetical protein Rsub_08827 [Raphidocelis subcapitata]|uniref:Uncharacterized protein n=1 Tax=Raphidocelis subcapitata TaxID=307507 RepID=A0A2V0PAP2_9CHLO|nr:hypothetical protein Rsub_08827 [Raphidocelis subcapitata]|eukprot:GBF96012.1 hypothetical protein Rsub_08827 [Raphidocelis subcapitata]
MKNARSGDDVAINAVLLEKLGRIWLQHHGGRQGVAQWPGDTAPALVASPRNTSFCGNCEFLINYRAHAAQHRRAKAPALPEQRQTKRALTLPRKPAPQPHGSGAAACDIASLVGMARAAAAAASRSAQSAAAAADAAGSAARRASEAARWLLRSSPRRRRPRQ